MNVVDSSGWLSYFAGERNATAFLQPIKDFAHLLVPSISLTEVFKSVERQRGRRAALLVTTQMQRGRVIDLDVSLALQAARFGLEYQLPLADSIIYATARRFDAVLWTQDADFTELPGVKFFV